MKARLLIIDDEAMVRDSMEAYLEDSGYTVVAVDSGSAGLEVLDTQQIDLILCDLRMPSLDGLQVLQKVKQRSENIPVIVVSGAGVMDDVVQALRLGASDYLVKPIIDMVMLEHSVQRNLELVVLERQNESYRDHLESANRELRNSLDELRSDQQAGRKVQMKMLPDFVDEGGLSFRHKIRPSLMLSGDFLDYFPLDDKHYGFYIADVSGHGASSAFVTVLLKNLTYRLKRNLKRGSSQDLFHPVKVLERINQELLDTECGKHLTIVYAVLNLETLALNYSVGAHFPMPVLLIEGKAQYLEGRGMPVGLFRDAQYSEYQMDLPREFTLSLFSDGVLELLTQPSLAQKEEYLLNLIEQEAGNHDAIVKALALESDEDVPDDIALMTVVRNEYAVR
ncbi:MAG: response regulator [Oleispira antarctica]|uniref:Response regulator receiver n=1 Tax=Oleispira antarctica RB-8 TaxID=698738 RepID=R4YRW6_OLEAN|nr:response regulator [Oleispira antarctica]MBQ0792395.1 response regulator [Oleispira antarctica]CCK75968.1 Response regulator receiver [Oleispira antarctica RB-8]